MDKPERKTMSVREMGQILGLKKTDSYWLVHKGCFEMTPVQGVMLDSFTVGNRIRIRRTSLEWWLVPQSTAFRRGER